ncbi:hypothetical protein [Angustibacter aerolatus]
MHKNGHRRTSRVERLSLLSCGSNNPNRPQALQLSCWEAQHGCEVFGRAGEVSRWVWARDVDATGAATPWRLTGRTACGAEPDDGPVLTAAIVAREFRRLDFARARVASDPTGRGELATLVNLQTYFRVEWPARGVRPGQAVTRRLLGHRVRLEPSAVWFDYSYGEGGGSGRTSSAGGRAPSGGVSHVYRDRGVRQVRVDTRYGGRFSVDGGAWQDVPGGVTVRGVSVPLHVYQARSVLVDEPCRRRSDIGCAGWSG